MKQFELFDSAPARSRAEVLLYLNDRARQPVSLSVTRNRVTMASVAFHANGGASVRLHEAFLSAPEPVLSALRTYIRSRRRAAWSVVREFAQNIRETARREPRLPELRAKGQVYDLDAIRREVQRELFTRRVPCRIGWGKPSVRREGRRSRSIRYGSWHESTRTIRIHPQLDDERVPREFVRYIVFHEMLHAVVPDRIINGRRYHHSPEFRTLERRFPDLPGMNRLSRELLDVLLPR